MDTINTAQDTSRPVASPTPAQLALLAQVVRSVARTGRLSPDDAEDFAQAVQLKFLERGYDVLRRFEGRSSLKTYLTVVVRRLLLDWQDHTYGKWRPTATALRLGPQAVQLERLMNRDTYSAVEAVQHVSAGEGAPGFGELRRLAERLPRRPHRRMVAIENAPVQRVEFDDLVASRDRHAREARIHLELQDVLARLSPEDRRLLNLRYRQNRSVPAIARLLQIDTKALYRRFQRVFKQIRRRLTERGVDGPITSSVH
jgi:RNA polymerase sigma factor (sigma-70 family)